MSRSSRRSSGFTLVELLIVAVILAILAAVVIPQFGEASEEVKLSTLKASLHSIRSQLEVYRLQHSVTYPEFDEFEDQMTKKTDQDGTINASGDFGPYFLSMPVNPMDNSSDLSASQNGDGGWMYDEDTGEFKSNDAGVTANPSDTKDL